MRLSSSREIVMTSFISTLLVSGEAGSRTHANVARFPQSRRSCVVWQFLSPIRLGCYLARVTWAAVTTHACCCARRFGLTPPSCKERTQNPCAAGHSITTKIKFLALLPLRVVGRSGHHHPAERAITEGSAEPIQNNQFLTL